jgi:hypothetical protein
LAASVSSCFVSVLSLTFILTSYVFEYITHTNTQIILLLSHSPKAETPWDYMFLPTLFLTSTEYLQGHWDGGEEIVGPSGYFRSGGGVVARCCSCLSPWCLHVSCLHSWSTPHIKVKPRPSRRSLKSISSLEEWHLLVCQSCRNKYQIKLNILHINSAVMMLATFIDGWVKVETHCLSSA